MGIKKFDFVDFLVQFFSLFIGVLVALLFVSGMIMPVHAEESNGYLAPNGTTYAYHGTLIYIRDGYGTPKTVEEVWTDCPLFLSPNPMGRTYQGLMGYVVNMYDSSSNSWVSGSMSTYIKNNTYIKKTFYKKDGTFTETNTNYPNSGYDTIYLYYGIDSTDFPIFTSFDAGVAYYNSGDVSGLLNPPPIDLEANGSLDENMPIPHITLHSHNQVDVSVSSSVSKYCHYVDNAAENYYIEVKGKWNSASDIELYRENLMWKSRVESVVSGALTTWISANDKFQSDRHFDFSDIENAVSAKNQLFADYPVESRNFYGGNNTIGDALTGKNAFIQDIKDFAIYSKPYTSPEFYVRFWYKDDNGFHYSKWTHFYEGFGSEFNQEEVPLQSDKGLTDSDLENVENGYSHTDPDLLPYDPGSGFDASMDSALSSFSETLKKFSDVSSGVTGMFVSIFSFLPWWSTAILGFAIVAVVILRFVGR